MTVLSVMYENFRQIVVVVVVVVTMILLPTAFLFGIICYNTVFRQMTAPCALTDILMNSGGPEAYFRGFSAILLIIDQFLPILSLVFHPKVVGCVYSGRCIYLATYSINR